MHQHQGVDDDAQDGRSLLLVLHTHQLQKVLSVGKGEEDKFCCLPEHPGVVWGQRHLVGIPERIIVCMLVSFYSKHESLSLSTYKQTGGVTCSAPPAFCIVHFHSVLQPNPPTLASARGGNGAAGAASCSLSLCGTRSLPYPLSTPPPSWI